MYRCGKKGYCCVSWSCLATAVFSLALGLAVYFSLPHLVKDMVIKKLVIKPGSAPYVQLQNPSLPIYKDFYFFNLTNGPEFANGAPPNVTEVGPYSFREIRRKFYNESSFYENNLLVYTQLKTYHFSPETSHPNVSEDDTICTLNIAMIGAIETALHQTGLERTAGIFYLKNVVFPSTNAQLYMCLKPTPLVFKYSDELVKRLHSDLALRAFNLNLPTDYISIQQNASINDSYPSIIHTGSDDINKVGEFKQWDGVERLNLWPGPTANDINGTEGFFFKPYLQKDDSLTIFVDDTLRSFVMTHKREVKIKGLDAYQYELPTSTFESAHTNPGNARWGSWCPNGLIYIGVLQTPPVAVFGSKPRFLDADPAETVDKVVNMEKPVRAVHDTLLNVHPIIGVTMQFQRSLQINMQVNQSDEFPQVKNINGTMYYPILYAKEYAAMTDDFKNYLMRNGLNELDTVANIEYTAYAVCIFLVVVGLILTAVGIIQYFRNNHRHGYQRIEPPALDIESQNN